MSLQPVRNRRLALELVAASFLVLFQELTLIRWLPGQVRVLAYFPNLILLATFLGLGVGCLRRGRGNLLWTWPPALLLTQVVAAGLSRVIFTQNSASEHLFLLYYDLPQGSPMVGDIRPPIVAAFILTALTFAAWGQVVAERLEEFRRRGQPLTGYAWDITGSLLGVVAFSCVSFAGWFPVAWFACICVVAAPFFRGGVRSALSFAAAAASLFVVAKAERAEVYSPYYALSVQPVPGEGSFQVLTNGSLHQVALDLRRDQALSKENALIREGYHLPYRLLKHPPRRALVIGAGTGNDVAVLLDEGAEYIDAVEIDPAILALGRARHPARPYDSPRVRVHNTDARAFLNTAQPGYDLIVFGTLDSMTRLSALSNVRLDNFVYTLESFQAAQRLLSPDGGLALYFMASAPYIDGRLAGMLTRVFGEVPLVVTEHYRLFNRLYLAGPAFFHEHGAQRVADAPAFRRAMEARLELSTDDWPYLYLRARGLVQFYWGLAVILALIAVSGILTASGEMRRSLRQGRGFDAEMFLFGFAFLLLETRAVTALNLLWGGTWLTSAVVFGAILATVLLATLVTRRVRPRFTTCMVGLALSLLVAYLVPTHVLLRPDVLLKLALSVVFVGSPIFFAGICFAVLFEERDDAGTAFGWNLLGAVAGGLVELTSMVVGLRALLLVALGAYLLAWLRRLRREGSRGEAVASA